MKRLRLELPVSTVAGAQQSDPQSHRLVLSFLTQILPSPPNAEEFAFMQGVHDNMAIVDLSPAQMGVLLTFVPPSSSYVLDPYALNKLRKSMSVVVKVLAHDYTDQRKNQASNILMFLPYMFLQYE